MHHENPRETKSDERIVERKRGLGTQRIGVSGHCPKVERGRAADPIKHIPPYLDMPSSTGDQEKPTRQTTPVDASRNSRPSRGAPSPAPLHPHPIQVPPAAQVEEESKRRDAGTATGRHRVSHTGRQRKRQTDGEEERGVERDTRVGKLVVDKELGGNLGGDQNHQWTGKVTR